MNSVLAKTDNTDCQQLFNAGVDKVYLLLAENLDISAALEGATSFFTLLISSDFSDADIEASAASGVVKITDFGNLLLTASDVVNVAGVAFTAQAGAATLGTATFRAATSNNKTAESLADQINSHATTSLLVLATAVNDEVTIVAKSTGVSGNDIILYF